MLLLSCQPCTWTKSGSRLPHCQWPCWYHNAVSDAGGWLASGVDAYRVTMEWDYKYIIRIGGCLLDQVHASVEMAIPSRASEVWGERKLLDEFEIDHLNNSYGWRQRNYHSNLEYVCSNKKSKQGLNLDLRFCISSFRRSLCTCSCTCSSILILTVISKLSNMEYV